MQGIIRTFYGLNCTAASKMLSPMIMNLASENASSVRSQFKILSEIDFAGIIKIFKGCHCTEKLQNLLFRYQDAIAVCRKFHKPDFFITFTCNPFWPEIQNELQPGQTASSRPDIVVRVFRLKLVALMDDLRYHGK